MRLPFVAAPGWWVGAKCRTDRIPLSVFFEREHIETARQICSECLVRKRCLTEHLEEPFGVWGGYAPNERERIKTEMDRGSSITVAAQSFDHHR